MYALLTWQQKLYSWSCNFLLVQLFINLITWPLFLSWGLPITPLSIIGNLVFSPFLTAFLMLSSLMVTCDLFCLPTWLFGYTLELITSLWLWLVACSTPHCMVTFITPPLPLALCAPAGATYIIMSKKIKTKGQKIAGLCALYCVLMCMFSFITKPERIDVPYGSHVVTIFNKNEKLTLLDPGFSRRTVSINQWVIYTLLPALGNSFGRQTVDKVILKKKTPTAHACAELLRTRGITSTVIYDETKNKPATEDARVKTKPSFRAVPLHRSKNPSYRNRSFPQSREYLCANA
jgi:hypothetical protein